MAPVHTVAHAVNHNSGLKRAKQTVERSGPVHIVVELEHTVNIILQCVYYTKTDAKNFKCSQPNVLYGD